MNAVVLYAGIVLALVAMLLLVFLVLAPPAPRVPLARRRAPGAVEISALTRVTDLTVGAIDGVISKRGNTLFGAVELEAASMKMAPSSFILMVACAAAVLGACGLFLGSGTIWGIPLMIVFAALAPVGGKILLVHDGWNLSSGTVIVVADREDLSWQFSK